MRLIKGNPIKNKKIILSLPLFVMLVAAVQFTNIKVQAQGTTVEELTEEDLSEQAKYIIEYCTKFGTDLGFAATSVYRYLQCDPSMVYFAYHCYELPERVPFNNHYCAQSEDYLYQLVDYVQFRQLGDELNPGFFYQIPNPQAFYSDQPNQEQLSSPLPYGEYFPGRGGTYD